MALLTVRPLRRRLRAGVLATASLDLFRRPKGMSEATFTLSERNKERGFTPIELPSQGTLLTEARLCDRK